MKTVCSFFLSHWRHAVIAFCGAPFLISLLAIAFSLADPVMAAFVLFSHAFMALGLFVTFSPQALAFFARALQDDQRVPVIAPWFVYVWFMMMVPAGCLACVAALRRVFAESSSTPPFEAAGATLAVLGCVFSAGHMRAIRDRGGDDVQRPRSRAEAKRLGFKAE